MIRSVRCLVWAAALGVLLVSASSVAAGERVYALTTQRLSISDSGPSGIEIIDADTFTLMSSFSVGNRSVASLAVSPDQQTLYVADYTGGEVAIYSHTGSLVGNVPVTTPRDLALSADGSKLYVAAHTSIVEIDTATASIANTAPLGSDMTIATALSRDGLTLGVTTVQSGGNPALFLMAVPGFSSGSRIAVTHPTYTARQVADVTFTDTGRALVWDSDYDSLYQFDVATATQLLGDTIVLTMDAGASSNFNNALRYSTVSDRAYVHRDTPDELAVFDPAAATATALGGFSNSPFCSALTLDESQLLVSVFGYPDTLDVLDVTTNGFTRNVYTFGDHARDMVVMPALEMHWISPSSGAWDVGSNWQPAGPPPNNMDVFIDPNVGVTVLGPASGTTVSSLTVGAALGGTATLNLQSTGTLMVSGATAITARGRLTGGGTFHGAGGVANAGEIDLGAGGLQLAGGTLTNSGRIRGSGLIDCSLANAAAGEVRVGSGQRMVFTGTGNSNAGRIEALGGEIEFTRGLTNQSGTGAIVARNAILRFGDGLTNDGSMGISAGITDVFGDVANDGLIVVSGASTATFYDDVASDGTIQVSAGSSVVFFGSLSGTGGTTGTGTVYIEGDLRPGSSPGEVSFGGDLVLGAAAALQIELAGGDENPAHDRLDVQGTLALGGALEVVLLDGYAPRLGEEFDILDFGDLTGEFAQISLPELGDGLEWDVSALYSTGRITALPEPATLSLLLVGGLVALRRRRR